MSKCLGIVHAMVNSVICHGLNIDMKLVKCAHEYSYELNLEIFNMCPLMKFAVLNWWHYEINMRLCAPCVENEILYAHYVKWLLCDSKWINDT